MKALILIVALMAMLVMIPVAAMACTGCGVFVLAVEAAPELAPAIAVDFALERAGPGEPEPHASRGTLYNFEDTSGGMGNIYEVTAQGHLENYMIKDSGTAITPYRRARDAL